MGTGMVKRAVRQELARRQDTKILAGHQAFTGSLGMDTIYTVSPQQAIVQGTDKQNRIGNEIFLRYIRLHGLVGNSSTVPETRYRVMCIATNKTYTGSTPYDWTGAGAVSATWLTDGLFIRPSGTLLYNALIDNQNTNFQVLLDKKIIVRSDTASMVKTVPFDVTCKVMKRVVFPSSSAGPLRNWNYYMLIIPYSAGKALNDPVGFVDSEYLVSFTDS